MPGETLSKPWLLVPLASSDEERLTAERRHILEERGAYVLVKNTIIADGIIADSNKTMEKI